MTIITLTFGTKFISPFIRTYATVLDSPSEFLTIIYLLSFCSKFVFFSKHLIF